jgi:hypothetical protein
MNLVSVERNWEESIMDSYPGKANRDKRGLSVNIHKLRGSLETVLIPLDFFS